MCFREPVAARSDQFGVNGARYRLGKLVFETLAHPCSAENIATPARALANLINRMRQPPVCHRLD